MCYEEVALIGYGAYGMVYKARNPLTDSFVALKKVRIPVTEDGVPIPIIREIALLRQLENFAHPNIVKLIDICDGKRLTTDSRTFMLHLVFEHVDQDLSHYLQNCPSPGLSVDKIRDIMFQIMTGVDFLHSNRIVHRDLKPQNILITNAGQVKLADFGLARIYEEMQTLTSVVVTLWYRSPEVILKSSYASPVDIWSCGCIFAELYTRKPLFPGKSESDQLSRIFRVIGSPHENEWPKDISISWKMFANLRPVDLQQLIPEIESDAACLLWNMITFDPSKRLSAMQILQQEFFAATTDASDPMSSDATSSSPGTSPTPP
jgi:serine/threonine protein kinase